jgi:hypothetical protein
MSALRRRRPSGGGSHQTTERKDVVSEATCIAQRNGGCKENSLPAAVLHENDARARDAARVVPADAQMRMLGSAVLGYVKQPSKGRQPVTWWQVMAWQRYNELGRLIKYRTVHKLDMGPPIGWAVTLANLAACLGREVDTPRLLELCYMLRLEPIEPAILAGVARDTEKARRVWSRYELLDAASTGELIQLTSAERGDLDIRRIDACDESAEDRKRRLTRERVRRNREKKRQQD